MTIQDDLDTFAVSLLKELINEMDMGLKIKGFSAIASWYERKTKTKQPEEGEDIINGYKKFLGGDIGSSAHTGSGKERKGYASTFNASASDSNEERNNA
jgi:hypothetical protein